MKRLLLSLMTVISFVVQPAVSYAAAIQGMSYPYSASTIYNLARGGNTYKLSTLSRRDMDVTNRYGDTALCIAVRNHDEEAYNNLLDAGVNPNPRCMDALESLRPSSKWASLLTPKAGYVFAALAVGGGIALASGGGGGGGKGKCSGQTQEDCEPGYHISGTCEEDPSYHKCSKNTTNTPENCAMFIVNKDECRVCQPLYYLEETDCLPRTVIDHCTAFVADEDACTACEDGYYLDEGVCKKGTISHCEIYASATECSLCEEGYVASVNDDACVEPIDRCDSYAASGICLHCIDGYRPSSDQRACVMNIPYCDIFNSDGTCQSCVAGYSLTADSKKCVPTIEHCKLHNPDGNTCDQCEENYATSTDKTKCVSQIVGCNKYDNEGNCVECLPTYPILDAGRCYNNDTFCTDVRQKGKPTCTQPMVKDFCLLPNYSLNTDYWSCKKGPDNCLVADQDNGTCITCASHYYVDNGVCKPQSIDYCVQYNDNENTCAKCEMFYYVANGGTSCEEISSIDLCYSSDGVVDACTQCYSGYYPNGSACSPVPNCAESAGKTEACTRCNSGYYPVDGVCTKIPNCSESSGLTSQCTRCNSTYYINEGVCTLIPNCSASGGVDNICTTCATNFYLLNGQCYNEENYCTQTGYSTTEPCESWQTTNYCPLPGGGSSSTYHKCTNNTIQHCVNTKADGSCSQCESLYYPTNNGATCSQIDAFTLCEQSDGINNACSRCNSTYYPDDNMCVLIPNCVESGGSSNYCNKCTSKYYPDNGVCVLIPKCVESNGSSNYCNRCTSTYYPDEGVCTLIPNCAESDGTHNMCQTCSPSTYLYTDNQCYNEQTYCSYMGYNQSTPCEQWQTTSYCQLPGVGDSSVYRKCQNGNIEHCNIYNGDGSCQVCDNLYYLTNGNSSCTHIDSNECSSSDGQHNACTTCNIGYYPNGVGTCTPQSIQHCSIYVTNENKCDTCNSKYYPTGERTTCSEITSFDQCQSSGGKVDQCGRCNSAYYINGNQCTLINNCQASAGYENTCTHCNSKYYINGSGTCSLIDNCQASAGYENVCTQCNSAYYPNGSGVCTQIPNCSTSLGYENKCTTCSTNYYLYTDNQCYNEQAYCNYTGYTQTTACQDWQTTTFCPLPGAGESSTYRTCTNGDIANCHEYNGDGSCKTCNNLYYLTDGGATCTPISSGNCNHSDGINDSCEICNTNYYPNGSGICTLQNIPNCSIFVENANQCDTCNSKYYPTNGNTVCSEITSFSNCDHSGGKTDVCQQCNSKYYIDGNQCTLITNCQSSAGYDNVCTQCNSAYYINGGGTCSQIPNCSASAGYENQCVTCAANYYLYTDNQCYNEQTYCNYTGYTQTTACQDWQTTDYCSLPGVGTSSTYRKCTNGEIEHCQIYNSDGSCNTCDNLFYVANGGATCSPISSGNCNNSDGIHNACETCNTNYYPNGSGICTLQNVPNCSIYVENTNLCDTCNSKYYPTNGNTVCSEITSFSNCDHSGGKTDACQQCNSKYYINGKQCTLITNCQESEGIYNVCTHCNSAYYINGSGTCSEVPNCEASYGYENKCVTCKSTHPQLGSNGVCYTEQQYCTEYLDTIYDNTTGCVITSQYPKFCPLATGGSSSTYRKCYDGTKGNCKQYSQEQEDYCTQCNSGYYVSGGSCSTQPAMFGCKTYKTDALGCSACYDGFDLAGGNCTRNSNYVAGGEYEYRVSSYGATQSGGSHVREQPVVTVSHTDAYSNSTVIGFTSTPDTASDTATSNHSDFGTANYAEYDVFNTTYSDNNSSESSTINLDGENIIGPEGHHNIQEGYDGGRLIGLSSPFRVDGEGPYGGEFVGHSSVYNAIAWYDNAHTQTGIININYQSNAVAATNQQYWAYGIYSNNMAYNAYSTKVLGLAYGIISLTIENYCGNYGVYAVRNAYNASGIGANGEITLSGISDAPSFYGVYSSLGTAANAADGAVGYIEQYNYEYPQSATANTVVGVYSSNGNAYNAAGNPTNEATATIKLASYNSIGVQSAKVNGVAYNAYDGAGTINLPYGGTALSAATAYNAYAGDDGLAAGFITLGSSSFQTTTIRICSSTTQHCYNAHGENATGTINIYGTPEAIGNFTNSADNGHGILNIYSTGPTSLVRTLKILDSSSVNGTNGEVNVILGSGWYLTDNSNAQGVIAIEASDLGAAGQVNIRKNTANKVYVYSIIGIKDGTGGGDDSSITIGGTPSSGNFIRANEIYGIRNLAGNIESDMSIKITAGLSDSADYNGYAYGIWGSSDNPKYTSNATIDMDIYGAAAGALEHSNWVYGLYDVDNGGSVTVDGYSDIDTITGLYGSWGTLTNSGDVTVYAHNLNATVIGMDVYSDASASVGGNINVKATDSGDTYGIRHNKPYGATSDTTLTTSHNSKITVTDSLSNSGNTYGVYIDTSGNQYHHTMTAHLYGEITVNTGGKHVTGVYVKGDGSSASLENRGSVNINISNAGQPATLKPVRVIGMHAVDGASISTVTSGYSTITITSNVLADEFIAGMFAEGVSPDTHNPSSASNAGQIFINCSTATEETGKIYGMLANGGGVNITNSGIITINYNSSTHVQAYGMRAVNGSHLVNSGSIIINDVNFSTYVEDATNAAANYSYYTSYEPTTQLSSSSLISVDETSTIENSGTIASQTPLKLQGGGRMLMSRGSNIIAPSVSGTLTLASDIVAEGNEDVYTTSNLVTGDTDDLEVESGSAMFTATTVTNAEDDNSVDGVMTRKPFDTLVQSIELANYLETNYAGGNAEEFFATLKTASNAAEFNKVLSKELGLCLMPNFAQENFNVFRSLGNLITDNLFSKEMTNERMMVGYDYLALSRDTHKGITGYENTSNSSYFIGDKALSNRSRFGLGLSLTKFNSDYDDDSDRDEMFAQLLASYMYDFGNKWRYAGVLHGGYGWGDYTRKLNRGDVDGNLHDFIYGLQNEFRYGIETPYAVIEPQLEMNFTGYYERRINEEHKNGSIMMKGTNNFSAESGIGLYVSREFNLEKYGKFKGRIGGSYYHEWAHPYGSIKARMRGTEGWYKIESDGIFQRDRFMISADVTYTYRMLDLYLRGSQYFEKDSVAVLNAGIKYNF